MAAIMSASPTTARQPSTRTLRQRSRSSTTGSTSSRPTRPAAPPRQDSSTRLQALLAFAMGAGYLLPAAPDLVAPAPSISMASTSSSHSSSSRALSPPPSPLPSPISRRRSSLKTCAGRLLLSVAYQVDDRSKKRREEEAIEVNFSMGDRTVIPRHLLPSSLPSAPLLGGSYDPSTGPPTQQLFVNGFAMDVVVDEAPRLKRVQPVLALAEFCKAAGATSRLDRDGEVKIDFD